MMTKGASHGLNVAAAAARYLVSTVAGLRGLMAQGMNRDIIKRQLDRLTRELPAKRAAIDAVADELKGTRTCAVHLGDIVAPTAHQATVAMVLALNREWFAFRVSGPKPVQVWPAADAVIAEIELELAKAKASREAPDIDDSAWPRQTQVAKELGVSRTEVQRMIVRRDLRTNGKRGHDCRIDPTSILAYCKRKGLSYTWNGDGKEEL